MSKHTSGYINNMKVTNEGRQCDVPGCTSNRYGIGRYCKRHAERKRTYGHPEAHRLRPSLYVGESHKVAYFLVRHSDHPGIAAATTFADNWLNSAGLGVDVPGITETQRLKESGVIGYDIVTEVLAIWLYCHWASRHVAWLGDMEVQARAIGGAILYLAKRELVSVDPSGKRSYRSISGRVRREVGRYFVEALAPFGANVMAAIEAEEQANKERLSAMRIPFDDRPFTPRRRHR